jgi:hypothetical protein
MGTFLSRLQPAVVGGGFELPDYWVWCGAPIRGEDGKYHLFASRVPKTVIFHPHWLFMSEIVRADSHPREPGGLALAALSRDLGAETHRAGHEQERAWSLEASRKTAARAAARRVGFDRHDEPVALPIARRLFPPRVQVAPRKPRQPPGWCRPGAALYRPVAASAHAMALS